MFIFLKAFHNNWQQTLMIPIFQRGRLQRQAHYICICIRLHSTFQLQSNNLQYTIQVKTYIKICFNSFENLLTLMAEKNNKKFIRRSSNSTIVSGSVIQHDIQDGKMSFVPRITRVSELHTVHSVSQQVNLSSVLFVILHLLYIDKKF